MKKRTILLAGLLLANIAQAATNSISTASSSSRLGNKVGVTTGFGNPFPSILGISVSYNLTDIFRASVGMGEVSVSSFDTSASVKTIGGGVDALVPGWNLSPIAGLRMSSVQVSKSGGAELEIQGINESTTLVYAQAGLDWQAQGGFNLGLGQIVGLSGGKASGSYLNIGWYF